MKSCWRPRSTRAATAVSVDGIHARVRPSGSRPQPWSVTGRPALPLLAVLVVLWSAIRPHPADAQSPHFVLEGPAPILTLEGIEVAQVPILSGAVQVAVVDPSDKDTVWIGTVNGGVWKTTDFRPDDAPHFPTWTPLTDQMSSLSISALALDPTLESRTLVAGLGRPSSFHGLSGPLGGLLRSTNGGASWEPLGAAALSGQDISGVAPRGPVIVVTSQSLTGGGVWRSDDTGATFTRLSGERVLPHGRKLPDSPVTSLVGDREHPRHLWLGLVGTGGNVYRSFDTGAHWVAIGPSALHDFAKDARRLVLAEQSYGADRFVVYVGVVDQNRNVPAIFQLRQVGDLSFVREFTVSPLPALSLPPFEIAAQGKMSLVADPQDENVFFVGGDEGDLFRCSVGLIRLQCEAISDRNDKGHTKSGTRPHGDSRGLVFDTDGFLLEVDDGGIFERTSPRSDDGDWHPKIGNQSITETLSCAYDDHGGVIFCGTQDNGVVQQLVPGALVWRHPLGTDGGVVAVSDALGPCFFELGRNCSSRYLSTHFLKDFVWEDCDADNNCTTLRPPLLGPAGPLGCTNPMLESTCVGNVSSLTPLAANRFDRHRLIVATDSVFESFDRGDTLSVVEGLIGMATRAVAYGGRRNGNDNPDLLYVGTDQGLFKRTTADGKLEKTKWNVGIHGLPQRLTVDPADWQSVWVMNNVEVWHTDDAGDSKKHWENITGDLTMRRPADTKLRSIAFVPGASILVVGSDDGLYVTNTTDPSHHWAKVRGELPNAVVLDVSYDAKDDRLIIGSLGRSVWTMRNASTLSLPPIVP